MLRRSVTACEHYGSRRGKKCSNAPLMLLNQAEITKYKAFYPESVDEGVNKQSGQAVQHHSRTFGLPMTSDLPHYGVSCDSCRFYRRSLHARFRCWPNLRLNLIARSGLGTKPGRRKGRTTMTRDIPPRKLLLRISR